MSKRKSIIISGYYGFHNLGDDAILEMISRDLSTDYDLTVLSRRPSETSKEYGLRAVDRYNLRKIVQLISGADLLISGGGTLLQDMSSVHSLLYYLLIIKIAQQRSVPVMIYASGIGPIIHRFSRKILASALSKTDVISLRDKRSREYVHELCAGKETFLTADPVLQMEASADAAVNAFFDQNGLTGEDMFAVSLREMDEQEQLQMSALLDRVASLSGCIPVFFCMQDSEDLPTTQKVRQHMTRAHSVLLDRRVSGSDMTAILKHMKCVIGLRFHALIFGALAGIHLIGFNADPKISAFLEELKTEPLFSLSDIGDGKTADHILRTMAEPCRYDLTELKERSSLTKKLVHAILDPQISVGKQT